MLILLLMMVPLGLEEGEVLIHLSGVMREWICNAVDAADDSVLGVGGSLSIDPFVWSPVGS